MIDIGLVNSRKGQVVKDYLASAGGQATVVEVVKNRKIDIGQTPHLFTEPFTEPSPIPMLTSLPGWREAVARMLTGVVPKWREDRIIPRLASVHAEDVIVYES